MQHSQDATTPTVPSSSSSAGLHPSLTADSGDPGAVAGSAPAAPAPSPTEDSGKSEAEATPQGAGRADEAGGAGGGAQAEAAGAQAEAAGGADGEADTDEAEAAEAEEEGARDEATPAGATAVEGERPKKKRRRRRRKKAPGAAAEGANGAPAGAGDGAGAAGEGAAEGAATAAEGHAPDASPSSHPASDKGDKKKKRRRNKTAAAGKEGAGPARERTAFHVGEEVFGKVTSVTEHAIMVDLSGKALAIFDRSELAADDLVPEVGDRFVAHVHGDGSRGGLVVLTRKPLREEEAKPRVEAAAKSGEKVSGLVTGVVKGGVEVDVQGLRAFAPASHIDLRLGADLAYLIGQRLDFTVAEYAHRGRDVVVSRKAELEAEAKENRKASLAKLEIGSVVKGTVRALVPYGVFVAIPSADEVEGLVHISEASHDRAAKLPDLFKPGQEIDVKVLRVDEKGKLWLSHRATIPDPWEEALKTYGPGTRHKGKVLRLQPFGAFVELAPGVEGLLHAADLSFKRIEHPKDILKEGDEIDVVVADFDRTTHKIALHPAPPAGEENEPRQKVLPHKAVKVAVVAAEPAGLVVRVIGLTGRQARGFIPAGQTGTERGTDLRRHFPVGTRLDAKVLEVDPRRGEAKLSLRAYKEDTEKAAYNEYRASVAKASKFGTLGDLLAKKRL